MPHKKRGHGHHKHTKEEKEVGVFSFTLQLHERLQLITSKTNAVDASFICTIFSSTQLEADALVFSCRLLFLYGLISMFTHRRSVHTSVVCPRAENLLGLSRSFLDMRTRACVCLDGVCGLEWSVLVRKKGEGMQKD